MLDAAVAAAVFIGIPLTVFLSAKTFSRNFW